MSELTKIDAPQLYRFIIGPGQELYKEVIDLFTAQGWREMLILNAVGSLIHGESEFPTSDELPPKCAPGIRRQRSFRNRFPTGDGADGRWKAVRTYPRMFRRQVT